MPEPITVPLKDLDGGLELPRYAYEGDAGMDLRSAQDLRLEPFQRATVPCGIAMAIPHTPAGFVLPRSGLAAKHGISIVNAPGLIDSNYRGEIKVILVNLDPKQSFEVKRGDRIAQLVVLQVPPAMVKPVPDLDETQRGAGGFGSSGVGA